VRKKRKKKKEKKRAREKHFFCVKFCTVTKRKLKSEYFVAV
jgi:hypothetical protein